MPLVHPSLKSPWWQPDAHSQTIWPYILRRKTWDLPTQSFETSDGDFFEIVVGKKGYSKACILIHGLEGSANSSYMVQMGSYLMQQGYDVYALHHRGCGSGPNRFFSAYHSGFTNDLSQLVDDLRPKYKQLHAVGFSLGGNILLKYRTESHKLDACVAISSPIDLEGCAETLAKRQNRLYLNSFLQSMKKKIHDKRQLAPLDFDWTALAKAKNFQDIDDIYTGPVHGYADAKTYWAENSSLGVLEKIQQNTLLIQAENDPFLSESCLPVAMANDHPFLYLMNSASGGHLGFTDRKEKLWLEMQVLRFYRIFELINMEYPSNPKGVKRF